MLDDPARPRRSTTAGVVAGSVVRGGESGREVHHFGGVPYASAERFGLPRSPDVWAGERDCTRPGPLPPQRTAGLELVPGMVPEATAEDCLTAEIWIPADASQPADSSAPADDDRGGAVHAAGSAGGAPPAAGAPEPRPVLVWIPGGSFRVGGAGLATYDGRHLAADGDLVVIGLNYRLGVLGFLAADGVPSNLGLRDLLAALDWIRDHAAAFGGDPERITLMGESAGAGAIIHLLTRPDLPVARAIVLSGSATLTLDAPTARQVADRFVALAGVDGVDKVATLSVEQILDAQMAAVGDLAATVGMMPFHPWVDGDVVPKSPLEAGADGTLAAIPVVYGTTSEEMELFRSMVPSLPTAYAEQFLRGKGAKLGLTEAGVSAGLAACDGDLVVAIADVDLHLPALALAESHARRGMPVWRASFTWRSPEHGACHAVDLPFHFGTFGVDGWDTFTGAIGADAAPAAGLSRRLREAWASFARTGRPACDPIGDWPVFRGGSDAPVIECGRDMRAGADPAAHRLAAWRAAHGDDRRADR